MNADQAQSFEHFSMAHATLLMMHSEQNGCTCAPYVDYFTYARWQAQGMQVQKGEKGVCLTTFRTDEKEDKETGKKKTISRPWRSFVFCRCQVKPIERSGDNGA